MKFGSPFRLVTPILLHQKMSAYQSPASPSLQSLCVVTKNACDILTPMIQEFYLALNSDTSKLKSDASVFTIADGIVQHLLKDHLFAGKFKAIVGEEDDTFVDLTKRPFRVDDLTVPDELCDIVESTRTAIDTIAAKIDPSSYTSLTVFIDPIDGTREFASNLGEQCSICIGFSDSMGFPAAGIVYRPVTSPATWAAGAKSENYYDEHLDKVPERNKCGFLTSNGGISPFVAKLISELGYQRVPSGGAGNKMLMLLEGKGACYIQDRGVSRWDTLAAQAVIEAHGGILCKLTAFAEGKTVASYTYSKSSVNLDFIPETAVLTAYNAADKVSVKKGEKIVPSDVFFFKPYSNLCGLLALDSTDDQMLQTIHEAIIRSRSQCEPSYD